MKAWYPYCSNLSIHWLKLCWCMLHVHVSITVSPVLNHIVQFSREHVLFVYAYTIISVGIMRTKIDCNDCHAWQPSMHGMHGNHQSMVCMATIKAWYQHSSAFRGH